MDGLSPQTVATKDVIPAARASAASASSNDVPTPRPRKLVRHAEGDLGAARRPGRAARFPPAGGRRRRSRRARAGSASTRREQAASSASVEPRLRAAEARRPGALAEPAEEREDRRRVAVSQRPDRDPVGIRGMHDRDAMPVGGRAVFARSGHLVDMARTGHVDSGHDGSGDPLLRARRPPDRLRDGGRGADAALRGPLDLAPRGGLVGSRRAQLLRGSRADAPRRALRPAWRRPLRPWLPRRARRTAARSGPRCLRRRAGRALRLLLRGARDGELRTRLPRAGEQARVLRRVRGPGRHPGCNAWLDRRFRPRQLVAGVADAGGAPRPTRERRRDRGLQPLHATRGGRRCGGVVARGRPHDRRARGAPARHHPLPSFSTAAATVPCRSAGAASSRPCSRTPASSR